MVKNPKGDAVLVIDDSPEHKASLSNGVRRCAGEDANQPPTKRRAVAKESAVKPEHQPKPDQSGEVPHDMSSTSGSSSDQRPGAASSTITARLTGENGLAALSQAKMDGKPMPYVKRTTREAQKLLSPQGLEEAKKNGYCFSLQDPENLSRWYVQLRELNPDGNLTKDLQKKHLDISVDLEMCLPDGFPLEPPFVRMLYPQLSNGFVFAGGGICFELLTSQGWAPAMSLPAVAMAIKGILDYGDVRLAGIGDPKKRIIPQYTEERARKDHKHIVAAHQDGKSNTYTPLRNYSS